MVFQTFHDLFTTVAASQLNKKNRAAKWTIRKSYNNYSYFSAQKPKSAFRKATLPMGLRSAILLPRSVQPIVSAIQSKTLSISLAF